MRTNITPAAGKTSGSAHTRPQRRSAASVSARAEARQALQVTPDRIRGRAYEIFEARRRNGGGGDELSDWLRAEQEVNGSAQAVAAVPDLEPKVRSRGEAPLARGGT